MKIIPLCVLLSDAIFAGMYLGFFLHSAYKTIEARKETSELLGGNPYIGKYFEEYDRENTSFYIIGGVVRLVDWFLFFTLYRGISNSSRTSCFIWIVFRAGVLLFYMISVYSQGSFILTIYEFTAQIIMLHSLQGFTVAYILVRVISILSIVGFALKLKSEASDKAEDQINSP